MKMVVVDVKLTYRHIILLVLLQHSDLATGSGLEDPDPCQSTSCGEAGVCEASPGQVLCKCPPGYSGEGLDGCRPKYTCASWLLLPECREEEGQTEEERLRDLLIEAKCPEYKDLNPFLRSIYYRKAQECINKSSRQEIRKCARHSGRDFCSKRLVTKCTDEEDIIRRCFQFQNVNCSFGARPRQKRQNVFSMISVYLPRAEFTPEDRAYTFSTIFCDFFEIDF